MPQPMRILEKPSKAIKCGMYVPRKGYVAGCLHPGEGGGNRLGDTRARHDVVRGSVSDRVVKVRDEKRSMNFDKNSFPIVKHSISEVSGNAK